jgi:hypothetical protein
MNRGQLLRKYIGSKFEPKLLDLYPNAAAAYSLRQLRTGATNVVRVRRSQDDAEQDFTAAQIKSGSLVSWVGAGNDGDATLWVEQSGNSTNLTQPVIDNQRRLVTGGVLNLLNGQPTLSGIGKFFNGFSPNVTTVYTLVTVFRTPNITASWSLVRLDVNNRHLGGDQFGTRRASVRAGVTYNPEFSSAYPNNEQNISAHIRNNLVGKFFNNGLENVNSPVTAAGNGAAVNGHQVGLEAPELQEIIIWPIDQSANINAIMANINAYYGIY